MTLPQRSKTQPPPVSTSPTPTPSVTSGTGTSWATVGKSGTVEKNISIAPKKATPRKYVLLNADDQRLDERLARPDKPAMDSLHDRITNRGKVCNDFHLLGVCRTQHCPFSHEPKLTAMEQLALRHKARNKLCSSYDECRDTECYWGHVCPYDPSCTYGVCFFGEMHGIDKRAAKKWFPDGTTEPVAA
ncbi:hypothetical protein H2201_007396 [Coniosporium apollinis]|uniref:C3H1-type domain-containing protein n=1 Tax=Coniosporium apollinis TaxID=61459 RepID=A0ABQ9NQY5_9PEZI|nr:hypothetical protein H2201_007396 [Coniosporium apollinis]